MMKFLINTTLLPILTLLLVGLCSTFSQLQAQNSLICNFACNDTINVSVNGDCYVRLRPDMFLEGGEGQGTACDNVQVVAFEADGTEIGSMLGMAYVNQVLLVELTDPDLPNRKGCWSYVRVEDKISPEIICPPNDTIDCDEFDYAANDTLLIQELERRLTELYNDNCGDETLMIDRNSVSRSIRRKCDTLGFAAVRDIEFSVVDNFGNRTSCRFTLYYRAVAPSEIDPPENFEIDCNDIRLPSVDGRGYPTVEFMARTFDRFGVRSMPNVDGAPIARFENGEFISDNSCNYLLSYKDHIVEVCGGAYKVVRVWTVIDWCKFNDGVTFEQVIEVTDDDIMILDDQGPFDTLLAASSVNCSANYEFEPPMVSRLECSDWTWCIAVREPGEVEYTTIFEDLDPEPDPRIDLSYDFPLDTTRVRYLVKDECGNEDSLIFHVVVVDSTAPLAVCDQRTIITLNDHYKAKVFASAFDDGSFDNCSEIEIQVRRMTDACGEERAYRDYVKFCCEDLGDTVMVELQVTNADGESSSCMVEAIIQFKGELFEVECQDTLPRRDCRRFDDTDLDDFVPPTIITENECLGDLTPEGEISQEVLDECGNGFKEVEWSINIMGRDTVVCRQRIRFENLEELFEERDINWPADRTISSCDDLAPTEQEKANLIPNNIECSNIVYAEPEDQVFRDLREKCVKIIRTWRVTDWCQYPDNPDAFWTHEQEIIVLGSDDPVFADAVANVEMEAGDEQCQPLVTLTPLASDDCTPDELLEWTYGLDRLSGGASIIIINETEGRVISENLDFGMYRAYWTVTDHCGNETRVTYDFEVEDQVAPMARCNDLTRPLNPENALAMVTASDINNNSTDDCDEELTVGIRRANSTQEFGQFVIYTCGDVGVNTIEMQVTDESGNTDICFAEVEVVDASNICEDDDDGEGGGGGDGNTNIDEMINGLTNWPCGRALDFDGVDDYIRVEDIELTDDFTVEIMVNLDVVRQGYVSIVEFGDRNPFIGLQDGRPTIFGQIVDQDTLPTDAWIHLAFTYAHSTQESRIYINGELSEMDSATVAFSGRGMGIAHLNSETHFQGRLDELRIWEDVRLQVEIVNSLMESLRGDEEGLLAYYDFNAAAVRVFDRTDNDYNGLLMGSGGPNPLPQFITLDIMCESHIGSSTLEVAGSIYTSDNTMVEDVDVAMMEMASRDMRYQRSNQSGSYSFGNAQADMTYELTAEKEDEYHNGVTALDLVMLQRHILGLQVIEDPYRIIAADADNNMIINTADMIEIRRLLLGQTSSFRNKSWRFVDATQEFDDIFQPWPIQEKIEVRGADVRESAQNFVGIKIGDLDGSAIANSSIARGRTAQPTKDLSYVTTTIGNRVQLDILAPNDLWINALSMVLPFSQDIHIENGICHFNDQTIHAAHDGTTRMIWSEARSLFVPRGERLLTMLVPKEVNINEFLAAVEASLVDDMLESHDIQWKAHQKPSAPQLATELTVEQNVPNPFGEYSTVAFELTQPADVVFEIFNINGKLMGGNTQHYPAGKHSIRIATADYHLENGIYFYSLQTDRQSVVRKMIVH